MTKKILSLMFLGLSVAASAAPAADIRFDQGVDVKAVMAGAGLARPAAQGFPRHLYWIQGCEKLEMAPGVNESKKFRLSSVEVVEECDYGYPGGGCRTGFGWSEYRDNVRLILQGRPAGNPTETFTVCLTGRDLGIFLMQTPTRYDVSVVGSDLILKARP